jgi:hypothetical protein
VALHRFEDAAAQVGRGPDRMQEQPQPAIELGFEAAQRPAPWEQRSMALKSGWPPNGHPMY